MNKLIVYIHGKGGNVAFISPVVNMEKLIMDMMMWVSVTEDELREKGEKDNLTSYETVSKLVNQSNATLTVMKNGEHWEETHCYLLCGAQRAVLIDTGLGIGKIREVVDDLTELPVTVITTHVHWDHIGGHQHFSHFEVHEAEKDWLAVHFPIPLQVVKHNLIAKPCDFPPEFELSDYQIFQGEPTAVFVDGTSFDLAKAGENLTPAYTYLFLSLSGLTHLSHHLNFFCNNQIPMNRSLNPAIFVNHLLHF